MAEYRVEWKMGGEALINVGWPHTEDEVRKAVERTLAGIAEHVADDIAGEVNAGVISYNGTAEATILKRAPAEGEQTP
jgi:hypothetical protein